LEEPVTDALPDYRRFLDTWTVAHSSDSQYHGISYPTDAFELPSPQITAGTSYELSSQSLWNTQQLPTLPEPTEEEDIYSRQSKLESNKRLLTSKKPFPLQKEAIDSFSHLIDEESESDEISQPDVTQESPAPFQQVPNRGGNDTNDGRFESSDTFVHNTSESSPDNSSDDPARENQRCRKTRIRLWWVWFTTIIFPPPPNYQRISYICVGLKLTFQIAEYS
jgi:hypothetical protein